MPGIDIWNDILERAERLREDERIRGERPQPPEPQLQELEDDIFNVNATTTSRVWGERFTARPRVAPRPRPRPIRITQDLRGQFRWEPVEELREKKSEDLLEDNMARKTIHEKFPEIEISDALYLHFYKSDFNSYYIRCINNEKGQDTFIIGMHRNKEGKLQMELVTHPRNEWFNIDKNTDCITVKKDLLKQEDK